MKKFVCSKEGFKDAKRAEGTIYSKSVTRTGCEAMVQFLINDGNEWILNRHEDLHNHRLVPENQRHLMRSARNIPVGDVEFLHKMVDCGIGASKGYQFLCSNLEEGDHLPYTLRDAQNSLYNKWDVGDVSHLFELIDERKEKDPGFFYDHDEDAIDRMEKIFWRDSRMKRDYEIFGDLVVFYTTHRYTIFTPS